MTVEENLARNFIDSADVIMYFKDGKGRFMMMSQRGVALPHQSQEACM